MNLPSPAIIHLEWCSREDLIGFPVITSDGAMVRATPSFLKAPEIIFRNHHLASPEIRLLATLIADRHPSARFDPPLP